jgi:nitrous oxide reductase accessory protein NosL
MNPMHGAAHDATIFIAELVEWACPELVEWVAAGQGGYVNGVGQQGGVVLDSPNPTW